VVDTHAHLSVCEPESAVLVAAARDAGVRRILEVGMGPDSNPAALEAAAAFDEVHACVGRHPNSATGFDDAAAQEIAGLARDPRVVAVGETGLDYYRDRAPRDDQRRAFEAQIEIARDCDKPLVIHMRESLDDTFDVLRASADGVTVILHCFSAPPDAVTEAADRGWYCSFAGNVTYPKSGALREAARLVPDELLLAETDSPFLAPQPQRGRPNQPANVVETGAALAEARGIEYAALEGLVEDNARTVFGW
jgi:TatD DNase family protein